MNFKQVNLAYTTASFSQYITINQGLGCTNLKANPYFYHLYFLIQL